MPTTKTQARVLHGKPMFRDFYADTRKKLRRRFVLVKDQSMKGMTTVRKRNPRCQFYVFKKSTPQERQRLVNRDGLTAQEHHRLKIARYTLLFDANNASAFRMYGLISKKNMEKLLRMMTF